LARTAETVVALAANQSGRRPPRALRRRKHVREALREAAAVKAKGDQK
jgi:hypothetical protein